MSSFVSRTEFFTDGVTSLVRLGPQSSIFVSVGLRDECRNAVVAFFRVRQSKPHYPAANIKLIFLENKCGCEDDRNSASIHTLEANLSKLGRCKCRYLNLVGCNGDIRGPRHSRGSGVRPRPESGLRTYMYDAFVALICRALECPMSKRGLDIVYIAVLPFCHLAGLSTSNVDYARSTPAPLDP